MSLHSQAFLRAPAGSFGTGPRQLRSNSRLNPLLGCPRHRAHWSLSAAQLSAERCRARFKLCTASAAAVAAPVRQPAPSVVPDGSAPAQSPTDSTSELGLGNRAGFYPTYVMGRCVGSGAFGIVNMVIHRTSGQEYACKIMPKQRGKLTKEKTLKKIRTEIDLLSRVQECQNVVTLHDIREDATYVYIVLENCRGGTVEEILEKNGPFTEHQAALVLYECLKVIATCHANGVVHGDIKPANFLLKERVTDALPLIEAGQLETPWLKAIDFGCSQPFRGTMLFRRAGTPVYMAPEVFKREYDRMADCWSLGMMFYQLMTGRFPFWPTIEQCRARSLEEVMAAVMVERIPLNYGPWLTMSPQGLDLFGRLTARDPQQRISAAEALEHDWFKLHFGWQPEVVNNIVPLSPAPQCSWLRMNGSPARDASQEVYA